MIRRKARDIERFVGMERFMAEIDRRGYQVAENSGQFVIFCNRAPIRWLTRPDRAIRAFLKALPEILSRISAQHRPCLHLWTGAPLPLSSPP